MPESNPEHTATVLMTVTLPPDKANALLSWKSGFINRHVWNEIDPGYYVMDAFDFASFILYEEESSDGTPLRGLYICFEDSDMVHEIVKVRRYEVTCAEGRSVDILFMAAHVCNPEEASA